jgi:hypothetical protein
MASGAERSTRVASAVAVFLGLLFTSSAAFADDELIAYIGSGTFFAVDGKHIIPTATFVAQAQDRYRSELVPRGGSILP